MTSVSNQAGLADLRMSTLQFIGDDPTIVVLTPGAAVKTEQPGGGYDFADGDDYDPQAFKLIGEFGVSNGRQSSESGVETRSYTYTMVGAHDCRAEVGCYWDDGDTRYTIESEAVRNSYERRFVVRAQGSEPNYG